jgi:hypothetical protein
MLLRLFVVFFVPSRSCHMVACSGHWIDIAEDPARLWIGFLRHSLPPSPPQRCDEMKSKLRSIGPSAQLGGLPLQ